MFAIELSLEAIPKFAFVMLIFIPLSFDVSPTEIALSRQLLRTLSFIE